MIYTITMPSGDKMFVEADEMVVNERILLMNGRKVLAVVSPQATVVANGTLMGICDWAKPKKDPFAEIVNLIGQKVKTPDGTGVLNGVTEWGEKVRFIIEFGDKMKLFEQHEISFP